MEMSVVDVATRFGRSPRSVQLALETGALSGHRRVGNHTVVDDIAVQAWARATGRGRRWSAGTTDAALDLLGPGSTERLQGSELSRLAATLRRATVQQIAYLSGGLGHFVRYRGAVPGSATLIGPDDERTVDLGLARGRGWMQFIEVPDLDSFELAHDVHLDPDGNVGVVERPQHDGRIARWLIDAYLLGDARLSAVAAENLSRRAAAVGSLR